MIRSSIPLDYFPTHYPIVDNGERDIDDVDGVFPDGIRLAEAEFSPKQRSS